jgi:flagellum-specific ATP synthase
VSAFLFQQQQELLAHARLMRVTGSIVEVSGLTIVADGLPLPVGATAEISNASGRSTYAQVVGFRTGRTVLMTLGNAEGISPGSSVSSTPAMDSVGVSQRVLGRVLNGLGQTIDDGPAIIPECHQPLFADAPPALDRREIKDSLSTGIRSIDAMLTLGRGQRIGLFAGTGVGKSVLMGMVARHTAADVTVIALIGERGREVGDFIRKDLGPEGMKRTVMVVSTSNESPVLRVRACHVATAVAEYFRDQGKNVLLLMDSVTRVAMAQRQIGLAAGEPPATKGYPPSVFALLPRLLERAGQVEDGSITGIYTVLTEGDDINEPISDAARGVLDGHVWLSRSLANAGHYPAVAVLDSISRVMVSVVDETQMAAARAVRRILATWAEIEDLVNIGAYAKGANPEFDLAVEMKGRIATFLQQDMTECATESETREALFALHRDIQSAESRLSRPSTPGAFSQQTQPRGLQPATTERG